MAFSGILDKMLSKIKMWFKWVDTIITTNRFIVFFEVFDV